MLNRIKINCKFISSDFIKNVGVLFSILGIISIFEDIQTKLSSCILKIGVILFVLGISLLVSIIRTVFNQKVVIHDATDREFYVKYGDIFKDKSLIKVIPVNCCFDTVVNDTLVSENTLHGQFINRYFHDESDELYKLIKKSLEHNKYTYEPIDLEEKPEGNRERYPFGSIAEIKYGDSTFYLLALTQFDKDLNAHCDVEQYTMAINRLMSYYDKRSQGKEISIPLIASGYMSRFNRGKQHMLETLVAIIKINSDKICGKLNIIVYRDEKNNISIRNLP